MREKLATHRDDRVPLETLVTIDTAVPLGVQPARTQAQEPDTERLRAIFTQLEFKALLGRIGGRKAASRRGISDEAGRATPTATQDPPRNRRSLRKTSRRCPRSTTTSTRTIASRRRQALEALCKRLRKAATFAFDTETTSTDAMQAALVGCSFCIEPREAWYIPVAPGRRTSGKRQTCSGLHLLHAGPPQHPARTPSATGGDRPPSDPRRPEQEDRRTEHQVRHAGDAEPRDHHAPAAFDTMVAGYLLRADGQHSLDSMALETFRYRMVSFDDLTGTGKNRIPITDVPVAQVARLRRGGCRLHHAPLCSAGAPAPEAGRSPCAGVGRSSSRSSACLPRWSSTACGWMWTSLRR